MEELIVWTFSPNHFRSTRSGLGCHGNLHKDVLTYNLSQNSRPTSEPLFFFFAYFMQHRMNTYRDVQSCDKLNLRSIPLIPGHPKQVLQDLHTNVDLIISQPVVSNKVRKQEGDLHRQSITERVRDLPLFHWKRIFRSAEQKEGNERYTTPFLLICKPISVWRFTF